MNCIPHVGSGMLYAGVETMGGGLDGKIGAGSVSPGNGISISTPKDYLSNCKRSKLYKTVCTVHASFILSPNFGAR